MRKSCSTWSAQISLFLTNQTASDESMLCEEELLSWSIHIYLVLTNQTASGESMLCEEVLLYLERSDISVPDKSNSFR